MELSPPALSPGASQAREAFLLVHGFIGSPKDFGDLGMILRNQGFTIRIMRLPGHATTPLDFEAQSVDSLLKAVLNELDDLRDRHDAVHLVGFSLGGALATLAASRDPPESLILIAPYYGVSHQWYYILPVET